MCPSSASLSAIARVSGTLLALLPPPLARRRSRPRVGRYTIVHPRYRARISTLGFPRSSVSISSRARTVLVSRPIAIQAFPFEEGTGACSRIFLSRIGSRVNSCPRTSRARDLQPSRYPPPLVPRTRAVRKRLPRRRIFLSNKAGAD